MNYALFVLFFAELVTSAEAPKHRIAVKVIQGINAVVVSNQSTASNVEVYHSNNPDGDRTHLLLTHHRREFVPSSKNQIFAPYSEINDYWLNMAKKRFHYYTQQSTKVLVEPLEVKRWVKDGDLVKAAGVKFQVIATPGYTRGAVSYLAMVNGKRCAFTGDLIYGDGKIFDLYSFQDAIPEAKVGGYHGYGARLADLVSSLQKIKAWKPDVI